MDHLQFVAIKLTIFLVAGILMGYYFSPPLFVSLMVIFFALIILATLHFRSGSGPGIQYGLCAMMGTIGLGSASLTLHKSFTYRDIITEDHLTSPHLYKLSIEQRLKSTDYYHRYIARVDGIDSVRTDGLLLCKLSLKDSIDQFSVDDKIIVGASIRAITPPANPHQFNYKRYMENLGVYHQIQIHPDNYLKTGYEITFNGLINGFRNKISSRMKDLDFGEDELSIIQALVLGMRDDIDPKIYDNYKKAGALHILAISGLHVGIIILILEFLLKPLSLLPRGRLLKFLTTILLLWLFALLAGFSASVVRAVSMFSFLAYAIYLNRPGSTFNILALSMSFILLAIDPKLLFQVGFQLSYAAVFSIVYIYPKLQQLWSPKPLVLRKAWQLFSVGLAAQAGVLPISLYYFHQFPTLFFLTNMAIVPFLGLILGMGLLVIILALLNIVPAFLTNTYNTIIKVVNLFVEWIAEQESFLFQDIYFDPVHLFLACLLIITMVQLLIKFKSRGIILSLCLIIGIQLWNVCLSIQTENIEKFTVLHKVGVTAMLYQNGNRATVFTDRRNDIEHLLKSYKSADNIKHQRYEMLGSVYQLGGDDLLVLNNSQLANQSLVNPDILVLSGSPKINLDRYIKSHQPQKIIADGSNYKSYVDRWRKSCADHNIPFHDTAVQGALVMALK